MATPTAEPSKVQVNESNAMRARTRREAKRKLLTRQSQIPSGPVFSGVYWHYAEVMYVNWASNMGYLLQQ